MVAQAIKTPVCDLTLAVELTNLKMKDMDMFAIDDHKDVKAFSQWKSEVDDLGPLYEVRGRPKDYGPRPRIHQVYHICVAYLRARFSNC